jgi:hypothetical protein
VVAVALGHGAQAPFDAELEGLVIGEPRRRSIHATLGQELRAQLRATSGSSTGQARPAR